MALNNLRVVYNNLVDLSTTATLTASSAQAATPASNLAKDAKGAVWRSSPTTVSGTTVTAYLLLDMGSAQSIHCVALPFTNLTSAATINVTGYSAAPSLTGTVDAPIVTGGTVVTNFTQTTTACQWNTLGLSAWGTNPLAANTYAYGGGTYATVWLNATIRAISTARYVLIKITDTRAAATGLYIEASRLVIGQYWTPKYNTGYGMTSGIKDLSTHERTESGDLVTQRGPRSSVLGFDLQWLDPSDRVIMTKILLGNGMPKPLFISLFPENGSTAAQLEMERSHQIYGKLMTVPGLTYSNLDIYNTRFDLEEV